MALTSDQTRSTAYTEGKSPNHPKALPLASSSVLKHVNLHKMTQCHVLARTVVLRARPDRSALFSFSLSLSPLLPPSLSGWRVGGGVGWGGVVLAAGSALAGGELLEQVLLVDLAHLVAGYLLHHHQAGGDGVRHHVLSKQTHAKTNK